MHLRADAGGTPMLLDLTASRVPGTAEHVVLVLDSPNHEWRSVGPTARELLRADTGTARDSTPDDVGPSSFVYAGLPWQ